MKHTKFCILLIIFTIIISGCGSEKANISTKSKNIVDEDLSDNVSINKCYFNEDKNISYITFYSSDHGDDDAVVMFDDSSIYYGSVFSAIAEDDYEKIIEYGDFAVYSFQAISEEDGWTEIEVQ